MKKKNIKLIIIVAIIILIFWAFVFFMVYNIMQRSSLITEFEEITELTSKDYETMDIEEINMRLDRTISSGKYAEVEKSAKQYLKDVFKNTEEIMGIHIGQYNSYAVPLMTSKILRMKIVAPYISSRNVRYYLKNLAQENRKV